MKKAIRKVVGVLLLVTALVVTQIPAQEVAADTSVASDFQLNGSTLVKYVGTASVVSVPATVNRIGEEAFAGNTTIKSISFKGEVEEIAYRAFAGCSELKEITIPDSVVKLGNGAFSDCTSLKQVEFGESLKTLGIGVFAGCSSLKEIIIDKDHEYFTVSDGCLYDKDITKLYLMIPVREKETYSMPSTVTDIAEYAFWGCNSVKNLSISNIIEEIPAFAFSNCKSLQAVSIPASVRRIDLKAFEDCVNLKNVWIPSQVNWIHDTAFDGCPKLNIIADIGTYAYGYFEEWQERFSDQSEYEDTGNNQGEDIDDTEYEPEEDTGDKQSLLGQTQVVGNSAFVFIDNTLPNVQGAKDPVEEEDKEAPEDGENSDVFEEQEDKVISIPKFTVAGETILADQAYYMSENMEDYEMPEGITEIGEFTFARSNLEKIIIPDGVTTIGYGAFYYCEELRNVTIPATVTEIEPKAFDGSLWIENWMMGGEGDFLVVGDGILLAYRGSYATLTIPENVKKIAPGVFEGHYELVQVTFPEGMRVIGEGAFKDCHNLTSIKGGKYITTIEDGAFDGCPIQTLHITSEVKEMGLGVVDFTITDKSTSTKVVVFDHTKNLPVVSYEETAGRLSNEEVRKPVLSDVLFAIVSSEITVDELSGTVLDAGNYGLRGVVGYISSESRSIVTLLSSTLTPAELEETYIPEYIFIDGKSYKVEGLEDIVYGVTERREESNVIPVANDSSALGSGLNVSASLEGEVCSLYLRIEDGESARETLNAAFASVYQQELPKNTLCFTMELFDLNSKVSMTKLGNNHLEVVLQEPAIEGTGSIRIVTVDRNGQLESVPYHYDEAGNLVLTLSHLSPFGIYRTNADLSARMDESPDTGDLFKPQYFVALGLFSLAMAAFFYKPKKRKQK